jgi:hypothetical protein
MKVYLATILIISCLITQKADADAQTDRIRRAAQENSAAIAAGNYGRVVDLTFPKVVEEIGGREKMIELLRHGTEEMKANGSVILGADVAEPREIVRAGDKRFAIVPIIIRAKVSNGTLRSKSFLLAISSDEGKTWTFIDGAGLTKGKLGELFPDHTPSLSLPAKEEPVLEQKGKR